MIGRTAYLDVLRSYARSHYRRRADGQVVNWLDENLDPFSGEWLSRGILDGLAYHGKRITILYDATGERYQRGIGLKVYVDERLAAAAAGLEALSASLEVVYPIESGDLTTISGRQP